MTICDEDYLLFSMLMNAEGVTLSSFRIATVISQFLYFKVLRQKVVSALSLSIIYNQSMNQTYKQKSSLKKKHKSF